MKWKWLTSLFPFGLAAIFSILLNLGKIDNPIIYAKADLGTLLLFFGLVLTILVGAGWALNDWAEHYNQNAQALATDERRRFLRRLDHELKNPLTAIRAGLANIDEAPSPEARNLALESVKAQALRLSRLSSDLRKLAELETRTVDRAPVDIAELLQEVFGLAQDRGESDGRHLSLTIPQAPWPLPKISGDQDLLFLAVHNLLDNAVKFTHPGNTVEIRAFEDGSSVVVEVADTGPGIPEDEVPHVWEELYRGKGARGVPGSGLGLALVRAIIEMHGGQVILRSRQGQGTVVSLRLPVG
jgi:two-component system OmpR family sensor kinase